MEDQSVAEAESLLERSRKGIKNTKAMTLPAREGEPTFDFELRILMGSGKLDSLSAAVKEMNKRELPVHLRGHTDLDDEIAWQLIWRAMYEPGGTRKVAKSADQLREYLMPDHRDAILDSYLDFEEEVAPPVDEVDPVVLMSIDAAIKKKGTDPDSLRRSLSHYGSRELRNYLVSMVSRQSN